MKIPKSIIAYALPRKITVKRDHNGIYTIFGQLAQSTGGAMRIMRNTP